MRFLAICVLAIPVFAGEHAVLSTGLRIRVQSHESVNGRVRLHTPTGIIEVPESAVAGFETEEYVPPAEPATAEVTPIQPAAVVPPTPTSPKQLVEAAALKAGLPPAIVHSVARAESGYRPDAVSRKGAIGLMQLMPGTAAELAADPHDPQQNADAGARYLRDLLLKYDGDVARALAAYNAGPGAVDRYKGVPPYAETRSYVNRVIRDYKRQTGEN